MSDCCCEVEFELVPEKELDIDIIPEEELDVVLDNVVLVHHQYTGINTDSINMNVDNENYTISAEINNYATIDDLDNIFGAQRS